MQNSQYLSQFLESPAQAASLGSQHDRSLFGPLLHLHAPLMHADAWAHVVIELLESLELVVPPSPPELLLEHPVDPPAMNTPADTKEAKIAC